MSVNTYDIGDTVRVTAEFRNADEELADPAPTPVLKAVDPAGNVTTPSVAKVSTGVYRADIPIPFAAASAGDWTYRWELTGAPTAAEEVVFRVRASAFYA